MRIHKYSIRCLKGTTLSLLALLLLGATVAQAETIIDNFTTTTNWGAALSGGGGNMSVGNGRMNYTCAVTNNSGAAIARNAPLLPTTQNWSLQVDAHIDPFLLVTNNGQFSDVFLGFGKTGDWFNTHITFEFCRAWFDSVNNAHYGYNIEDDVSINGVEVPWDEKVFNSWNLPSGNVSLRMDYISASQTITYYFDSDGPANGYQWVAQGIANLASGTYNLNLSPTDTFTIFLLGSSEFQTVAAGQAYLSNLEITLPRLDYFGVGVNWANVTNPPGLSGVRGDIGATNLYNHLQTDLSSIFGHGTVVALDATGTTANNLNIISTQFGQFTNGICTNDTVVFYVASHGGILNEYGLPAVEVVVSVDATNSNNIELDAVGIKNLLNLLPASTRKVVILEACHSGGIAKYLADNDSNISILAASSPSYQIIDGLIYGGVSYAAPDGTGVFTDSLIMELDRGIFNLNQIVYDIDANNSALYTTLLGQNLYLEDSGTAVFTGLQPQLYAGLGFTGNLANNTVTGVQLPPKVSNAKIVSNSFQMTLTNVPSSGSIAIEVSTNLNSWLQVAFNPAAGTNLNYSFSVTNAPQQFFCTIVVP